MNGGVFPDLFDNVRTDSSSIVAAQGVLQILSLHPVGAKLSVTHGIDSSLLLNQCCTDSHFLTLVSYGRIRFARWPDGKGIRDAFDAALNLPADKYLLSAWPELRTDPDLRSHAREVWSRKRSHSGNDEVDKRIEHLSKLAEAIETFDKESSSGNIFQEAKRDDTLAQLVSGISTWPIIEGQSASVKTTIKRLSDFNGKNSRGQLYTFVQSLDISNNDKDFILDIIDECYNVAVAKSLSARVHTSSHRTAESFLKFNRPDAILSNIQIEELSGDIPVEDKIAWKDIINVLPRTMSDGTANRFECESSFKRLMSGVHREDGKPVRLLLTKIGTTVGGVIPPTLVAVATYYLVDIDGGLGIFSRQAILDAIKSYPVASGLTSLASVISASLGHLWTDKYADKYENEKITSASKKFNGFLEISGG